MIDGAMVYREWSSIADGYTTHPIPRETMTRYLMRSYSQIDVEEGVAARRIDERLARADANGTSSLDGDTQDVSGPWETERCEGPNGCGGFHHVYAPRADGSCSECGEGADERSHGPECG